MNLVTYVSIARVVSLPLSASLPLPHSSSRSRSPCLSRPLSLTLYHALNSLALFLSDSPFSRLVKQRQQHVEIVHRLTNKLIQPWTGQEKNRTKINKQKTWREDEYIELHTAVVPVILRSITVIVKVTVWDRVRMRRGGNICPLQNERTPLYTERQQIELSQREMGVNLKWSRDPGPEREKTAALSNWKKRAVGGYLAIDLHCARGVWSCS